MMTYSSSVRKLPLGDPTVEEMERRTGVRGDSGVEARSAMRGLRLAEAETLRSPAVDMLELNSTHDSCKEVWCCPCVDDALGRTLKLACFGVSFVAALAFRTFFPELPQR